MTIEEGDSHPPQERPSIVTREYVIAMLAQVISKEVPPDLLPAILDYLVAEGVVTQDGISYSITAYPDSLADLPSRAIGRLRSAIDKHSQKAKHSRILLSIVMAARTGGTGGPSQAAPGPAVGFPYRSARECETEIEELRWERKAYLRHFAIMGEENAARLFDIIVRIKVAGNPPAIPRHIDSVRQEQQRDLPKQPDRGFATAFDVFHHWRTSLDRWREFVTAPNVRSSPELWLTIPPQAAAASPINGLTFGLFPPPAPSDVAEILQLPGHSAFIDACNQLAGAADQVVLVLLRHGLPTAEASALAARLRIRDYLPTLADNDATWVVQRQLEDVQSSIWNGGLPPEEDILERRAFWQHRVLGMKTPEGRAKLEAAVTDLLRSPRNPDRELEMLNAACSLEKREELMLRFAEIPSLNEADAAAVCRRWRALIDFGLQHFARNKVVNFTESAWAEGLSGNKDSPSQHDLLWARSTRETTLALLPLARTAGFDVAGTKPIHVLVRALDSARIGQEVDLDQTIKDVDVIVAEIESQQGANRQEARKSTDDPLNRWHALRENWGRPRNERGGRPVFVNWQTWTSIDTATQLASILEDLLPEARAANPSHALVLLELVKKLRDGAFLATSGKEPFIACLERVDLIIADIEAVRREKSRLPTDLSHHAEQFAQLAGEFQACRTGLRDNPSDLHLIAETRTLLASAGALLVDLVRRHAIVAPDPAPPWLAWLTSAAMLQFGQLKYGSTFSGGTGTFPYMLKQVDAARSLDAQELRGPQDPDNRSLHNRHIFLEAITWIGSRCTPPVDLQLPTGSVEVDGTKVTFVADCPSGTADQTNLLLRNIGRAAETVCNHLARWLRQQAPLGAGFTPGVGERELVVAPVAPPLAAVRPDTNRFMKDGDYWTVVFDSKTTSIIDAVGMGYIQQLLAAPKTPIHSWTLRHKEPPPAGIQDEMMDHDAIDDVRKRITDLRSLLESSVDLEEREHTEAELKAQQALLRSATERRGGKRGARSVRDELERNRESVGKAIRTAINRIGKQLPELRDYLNKAIDSPTGFSPCYRPATDDAPWQVTQ